MQYTVPITLSFPYVLPNGEDGWVKHETHGELNIDDVTGEKTLNCYVPHNSAPSLSPKS